MIRWELHVVLTLAGVKHFGGYHCSTVLVALEYLCVLRQVVHAIDRIERLPDVPSLQPELHGPCLFPEVVGVHVTRLFVPASSGYHTGVLTGDAHWHLTTALYAVSVAPAVIATFPGQRSAMLMICSTPVKGATVIASAVVVEGTGASDAHPPSNSPASNANSFFIGFSS